MITSAANPKLRYVRALARRAFRAREGSLVVEGMRAVDDALAAGAAPRFLLVTPEFLASERADALQRRLGSAPGTPILEVGAELFADLTDTVHPQGVLAVIPTPQLELPPRLSLVVILDGLRDPGNVGTLLRTAAAAGADALVMGPGSVDWTNPKVVRAAMGAHFRLPVRYLDWAAIGSLAALHGLTVLIADAAGGTTYTEVDWRAPSALVVGSEAHGISPAASALASGRVRIPMPGGVESLNAATSAAVVLFEAVRQREG